jgi:predicted dehydrogenase
MHKSVNRRTFLKASATAAAFTIVPRAVLGQGQTPPSAKLNIAGVGVGGKGFGDIQSVPTENIVALCDVDRNLLGRAAAKFPQARTYADFRKMLESQKDIDAVICATPDHMHAPITMMAIKMGKHVFCQKPLTHSVFEARAVADAARAAKVATQMGNQGQADEGSRLVCEMIADGAIGPVREIHAWSNRPQRISQRGVRRPADSPPVPEHLDWDLWLGPAPARPYHPCYHPFSWRGWWDFGTGVLGDIGCHQLSTVFKALKLGHPVSVEACSTNEQEPPEVSGETAPLASITTYKFAATENHPDLVLRWYDGAMKPPRPECLEPGREFGRNDGTLIVGEKGMILDHRLIPDARQKEYGRPPQKLARSPGHYEEWLRAAKGGEPAGSDFALHAGHLAEVVLLGNIAIRTREKLLWDPKAFKFTNSDAANALLNPPYRQGWTL